jgi:hypothetical protein
MDWKGAGAASYASARRRLEKPEMGIPGARMTPVQSAAAAVAATAANQPGRAKARMAPAAPHAAAPSRDRKGAVAAAAVNLPGRAWRGWSGLDLIPTTASLRSRLGAGCATSNHVRPHDGAGCATNRPQSHRGAGCATSNRLRSRDGAGWLLEQPLCGRTTVLVAQPNTEGDINA